MENLSEVANLRTKIAEIEKENMKLQNQVEILNNELSQKNAILNQTNKELTELQTQYRQSLDKIVELSTKSSDRVLTPEEERVYRNQLSEQASCIAALQDRLWESENTYSSRRRYSGQADPFSKYDNLYNRYDLGHNNYENNSYGFCDPIPNIDRAEKKIISLHQNLIDVSKENDYLKSELRKWSKFVISVFNVAAEGLNEYPGFPSNDIEAQRNATFSVVKRLAKMRTDSSHIYAKYNDMKEKYQKAKEYLKSIESRCNHLSQIAQRPPKNPRETNQYRSESISESGFLFQPNQVAPNRNCYEEYDNYCDGPNHIPEQDIFSSDEEDEIPNVKTNMSRLKSQFNEKKIAKSSQREFGIDDDYSYHYQDQKQRKIINRTDYSSEKLSPSKYVQKPVPKSDPVNYIKQRKEMEKNYRIHQGDFSEDAIRTDKMALNRKQIITQKNQMRQMPQKKEKEMSMESDSFKYTKSNRKNDINISDIDANNDSAYSNLGGNLHRLTGIVEKMKTDYYDFAEYTDEIARENNQYEQLRK